jgi:hypothetical protein
LVSSPPNIVLCGKIVLGLYFSTTLLRVFLGGRSKAMNVERNKNNFLPLKEAFPTPRAQ